MANAKETVMKTKNSLRWIGIVSATLVLAACQGQNPVKSSADLAKDYPNAMKANVSADGPQLPPPEQPDNTQLICGYPFLVDIEGDQGDRDMTFVEEQEQEYFFSVRNRFGDAFKTSKEGPGTLIDLGEGRFSFRWKPAKDKYDQKPELLQLAFTSPKTARCGGGHVAISLITYRTRAIPTIGFANLPTGSLKADEKVAFQVSVKDPGATVDNGPSLTKIGIRLGAITSQNRKIDGSKAVYCANMDQGRYDKSSDAFLFDCQFDANLLSPNKNSKTVDAVFFVQAVSGRTRRASVETPTYVTVEYAKKQTQTAPLEARDDATASDAAGVDQASEDYFGPVTKTGKIPVPEFKPKQGDN